MSVYKDIKSLSSELKMENHELKSIDDELKKLILKEIAGIFKFTIWGDKWTYLVVIQTLIHKK